MLEIQCRQCGTRFRLPDQWAGKQGKCPKCGYVLSIPPAVAPAPQKDTRGVPLPWLIGPAAGVTVILLGLVIFGLSRNGDEPKPEGPVAEAGDGISESSSPGEGRTAASGTPSGSGPPRPSGEQNRVGPPSSVGGARPPGETGPLPPDLSPSGSGTSVAGVSGEYDDRHCRMLQARFGIRIPAAATIIEVDGQRLPIANPGKLSESRAAILFLPRGDHLVRFRPQEPIRVTVHSDLFIEYEQMRQFFGVDGRVDRAKLTDRGARALDVHGSPFLLNFMGAMYAAEKRWAEARRKFRRALCVNPTFTPAHLNLAECLLREGLSQEAAREVELAAIFNVGNVFGLAGPIAQFRRKLGMSVEWGEPIDAEGVSYLSTAPLSEEDLRLTALMEGISKYAVSDGERGKILNNLAVHFADKGHTELALHHFRNALEAVRLADPRSRYDLTRRIFSNMSDVCRKAGFAEAVEYQRMRLEVKP